MTRSGRDPALDGRFARVLPASSVVPPETGGGPRFVGRIVDPDVEDEDEDAPLEQLSVEPPLAGPPPPPPSPPDPRDRPPIPLRNRRHALFYGVSAVIALGA